MPGSTNKKVVVIRFDREPVAGYVSPATYLQPTGIELLTGGGSVLVIPYEEIKTVCFVKSWEEEAFTGERKEFTSRPKLEGLWVKFDFRDGDAIEALLPNRLQELDTAGFLGTPPDASANTQRIFVPRAALTNCSVLGVVGAAKRTPKKPAREDQLSMFD